MAQQPAWQARPHVFELRDKAKFLMTHPVPLGVIGQAAPIGLNRLYRMTGIPLRSLQTAMHEGNDKEGIAAGDDKLGMEHQELIADLYKFDVGLPHNTRGWQEWSDPRADDNTPRSDRGDTFEKFQTRYLRQHGPPERDTTEQLMEGESRQPQSPIEGLATVWLTCGQTGQGQSDVGVVVSCDQAPVEVSRFKIALRKAILVIDCGKARARHSTIKGFGTPGFEIEGSLGAVQWACNAANAWRLRWRLESTGVCLGTMKLDPGELVTLDRLAHGDVIKASLSTWLKYIEPKETDTTLQPVETDIAFVDRSGKEVALEEEQLTVEQQRIMEHLRKRLLNTDDDNYAVVAQHELVFERRR